MRTGTEMSPFGHHAGQSIAWNRSGQYPRLNKSNVCLFALPQYPLPGAVYPKRSMTFSGLTSSLRRPLSRNFRMIGSESD